MLTSGTLVPVNTQQEVMGQPYLKWLEMRVTATAGAIVSVILTRDPERRLR